MGCGSAQRRCAGPCNGRTARLKKTVRAQERDEGERVLFQDLASTVQLKRLVVVDESGTQIGMTPAYARAPAGKRAYSNAPFNRGRNYTLLASLRASGMTAPFVIEGAADTAVFETYVQHILCPTLLPGDLVIMDNVRFHKATAIEALIAQRGAAILWLPAYSPDLSPIEQAFSKLKQTIRRAKATTYDALLLAIERALKAITHADALAWFINCGFFNLDQAT
jgi:transposase